MKVIVLFVSVFAVVAGDLCYNSTKLACQNVVTRGANCTTQYGFAHKYIPDFQKYANMHITRNFQYLLMSSFFGNYRQERGGFKKLYRKLSDQAWEDAIHIIKYITRRGGSMDFHYDEDGWDASTEPVAMTELESLAKSVDIQKKLALKAHEIYKAAHHHDPEVSDFLEDKFLHKHAKTIRELSGHTYDLRKLLEGERDDSDVGFKLFIVDSYLEKIL